MQILIGSDDWRMGLGIAFLTGKNVYDDAPDSVSGPFPQYRRNSFYDVHVTVVWVLGRHRPLNYRLDLFFIHVDGSCLSKGAALQPVKLRAAISLMVEKLHRDFPHVALLTAAISMDSEIGIGKNISRVFDRGITGCFRLFPGGIAGCFGGIALGLKFLKTHSRSCLVNIIRILLGDLVSVFRCLFSIDTIIP